MKNYDKKYIISDNLANKFVILLPLTKLHLQQRMYFYLGCRGKCETSRCMSTKKTALEESYYPRYSTKKQCNFPNNTQQKKKAYKGPNWWQRQAETDRWYYCLDSLLPESCADFQIQYSQPEKNAWNEAHPDIRDQTGMTILQSFLVSFNIITA